MIASRKLERLRSTANELQQHLPADGTAELDFIECNIRNENQVITIKWFVLVWLNRSLGSSASPMQTKVMDYSHIFTLFF